MSTIKIGKKKVISAILVVAWLSISVTAKPHFHAQQSLKLTKIAAKK